jgi:hypothetical protein
VTDYNPDRWVVLKLPQGYKVLGGWTGGYLYGSTWRLNSGIVRVEKDLDYFLFHGYSKSIYRCYERDYGFNTTSFSIYNLMSEQAPGMVELMPADTDWLNVKWDLS